MASSLDSTRIPTEAETRRIRVAYQWMLLPNLALAAAIVFTAARSWNGDPGWAWIAILITGAIDMGYQLYVGSLRCPRCGMPFMGDLPGIKPRFILLPREVRCAKCGLSMNSSAVQTQFDSNCG